MLSNSFLENGSSSYADVFLDPKSAYSKIMRDDWGATTLNPISPTLAMDIAGNSVIR